MTTDAAILKALRLARPNGVSGAALSTQLGISRAAIWARIEELRRVGYGIEASPHGGYELRHVPDVLHADDLTTRLNPGACIGRDIRVFKETTSTNDIAEKFAQDGVGEGVVVFAESQTRGRGRLGRRWESTQGKGLWFTVLLRPSMPPQAATRITLVAAVALVRGIRAATGLEAGIKWPNDVQIRGRKVAGILTEMNAEVDRVRHLLLGIGINVNHEPGDFIPEIAGLATSLGIEKGEPLHRATVAAAVLQELDVAYGQLRSGGFAAIVEEWERHCTTLGEWVRIQVGPHVMQGRAESLDEEGVLLLRSTHGTLDRVLGGDVTVIRPSGPAGDSRSRKG